jgi:hypothetical protein
MRARLLTFLCCALLAFNTLAQSEEQRQRAAVERLFEALRTMAVVEHLVLPAQLRNQAVESWGFEPTTLGLEDILGMEGHVDWRALHEEIAEAHMTYLSAAQALEAAQFFESAPARRVWSAQVRDSLPSSDPMRQAKLPPPTADDQRALEEFSRSAVGQHLAKVNPAINSRVQVAIEGAIDAAIAKYVAARGLPNARR